MKRLIRNAEAKGEIERILVASWSDQNLPDGDQELSREERELAENRSSVISNFLNYETNAANVETHNMAEPPGWLAKQLETPDSEIKEIFDRRSPASVTTNSAFEIIKREGAPRKAVLVVEFAERRRA